jgi:hypothetical protein
MSVEWVTWVQAMKRLFLIGLLAIAGAANAAPPPPAWATLTARETRTAARIEAAEKAGQILEAEAARLRQKLHRTQSLRAFYRKSHGMSAWERRDIERRLKTLDARLTKETRAAKRQTNPSHGE